MRSIQFHHIALQRLVLIAIITIIISYKSNDFLKQHLLITAAAEKCTLADAGQRERADSKQVYVMFHIWEKRTSVARLTANKYR